MCEGKKKKKEISSICRDKSSSLCATVLCESVEYSGTKARFLCLPV